ncbi:MAG: YkgJ family cysteine cluster protein [candidate division Zixibacteria bacterium]|nr:YkgJ family cysteine cluster protein [candidate division Zixibacteria bacterium]
MTTNTLPRKLTKEICMECGAKCCRNIAIEIEAPTTTEYKEYIRWYLAHKNVSVFVEEGDWYVEFHTDCRMRKEDNTCAIYECRPQMCREYGYDDDGDINCFISEYPFNYEHEFHSLEEFDRYLAEEAAKRRTRKKPARSR